jgi:RecA-family ATPase
VTIQSHKNVYESSTPVALFDRAAILTHFSHLHHAAKRANIAGGKVVLAVFGQDPDTIENFADVRHFEIGDVEGMTNAAMEFDGVPHRNVYNPLVVLKPETPAGSRKEADIAAVLGFVVDGDADKGREAPTSPLPADYIIESSAGNQQYFLWLDQPLPPEEAKAYARALKRATGADAANDIVHVWRVAGCLNWPNAAKVKRGRSRVPDPVRVKWPWSKWTNVNDLRSVLAPHWEKPRAERSATAAVTVTPGVCKYRFDDAKNLYQWLADNGAITTDEDWYTAGMVAKFEFGEAGLDLWEILATQGGLSDESKKRWKSFGDREGRDPVRLGTITKLAHDAGWTGRVVETSAYMFRDVVAQLAANAGATLPPPLTPEEQTKMAEDMAAGRIPGPGPVNPDWDDLAAPALLRVISAASFAGKPVPEREMLVEGLIPARIAAGLYGEGAVGKSLLALMLAIACVTGTTFLGRNVKHGPVIYLCCEDDEDEVHRRLAAICRFLNIDIAALGDLFIVPLADEDAVLAATDGRSNVLTTTYRYDQVVQLAEDVRPVLVIGDTLADVLAATENDRMIAKQFVRKMRPLAVPYGGTFLVLAHPSLSGIASGRGSSGSTGWRNTFRWDGYLHKVLDEAGQEADPNNRVLQVMKANYGPQDGEIPLRYVQGCYMVDTTRLAGRGGDPMVSGAKAEKVFLELLKMFIGQNRYVSVSDGKSYAPFVFAGEAAKRGVNKRALKDAMERLISCGQIANAPHGAPSKKMYRLYPANAAPANGVPEGAEDAC